MKVVSSIRGEISESSGLASTTAELESNLEPKHTRPSGSVNCGTLVALDKESSLVVDGDDRGRFTTCFLRVTLTPIQGLIKRLTKTTKHNSAMWDMTLCFSRRRTLLQILYRIYVDMPNGRGFVQKPIDRTFPVLLPSERVHHNDTRTLFCGVGFHFVCTGANSKLVCDTPSGWLCCFGLPSPEIPTRIKVISQFPCQRL